MRIKLVLLLLPFAAMAVQAEIAGDPFLRSQLLPPEHARDVRTFDGLWLNDKLRIGLALRTRYEQRENNRFSEKDDRDYVNFIGQSSQLWLLARPAESLAIKFTLQDNRLWGGNGHPPGDTGQLGLTAADQASQRYMPELREAFLVYKFSSFPLSANLGRQVFFYGDARLIGPRNWLNGGNSFDGLRLRFESKSVNSDWFAVALAEDHNAPNQLISASAQKEDLDRDAVLVGSYNGLRFAGHLFEGYALGLFRSRKAKDIETLTSLGDPLTIADRGRLRDQLVTLGTRFTNRPANQLPENSAWDYTAEAAWQTGFTGDREFLGVANDDLTPRYGREQIYNAWFGVLQGGYTAPFGLRLGGQILYATGDGNLHGRVRSLFNPLFGNRHGLYPYWSIYAGESDGASMRNMFLTTMHLSQKTANLGTFHLAIIEFRKANSADDWYGPSGNATGLTRGGSLVYREADLSWHWYPGDFVSLTAGFTVIYAGDAVQKFRGDDFDPLGTFWYLMVNGSI